MPFRKSKQPDIQQLANGIKAGDRFMLSRAITLVESRRHEDIQLSGELIDQVMPGTGNSLRVGITGVPGVGKSTFIEVLGLYLTGKGQKVAVLSIDPSSTRTRGSILGDKTRMDRLSRDENAFIRPSPSGSHLGGVAQKTREAMFLCEAAGFDIVIVETVGVGQSETAVKNMVDFFLLLAIVGGGDELQGIKRGIMEMADMVCINKIDDPEDVRGKKTAREFKQALHLFPPNPNQWTVPVQTASALKNRGIEDCWKSILSYEQLTRHNGFFEQNRKQQNLEWFGEALKSKLIDEFYAQEGMKEKIKKTEEAISSGQLSVRKGIDLLYEK